MSTVGMREGGGSRTRRWWLLGKGNLIGLWLRISVTIGLFYDGLTAFVLTFLQRIVMIRRKQRKFNLHFRLCRIHDISSRFGMVLLLHSLYR